jgi:uncharacterized protein (DUF362 family)
MSRVAVVKYSGNTVNKFLSQKQYSQLLEAALRILAGDNDYQKFVKRQFPGGIVGMKTNCLTSFNPTLLPLVDALSEILEKSAGIEENNLVVWERTNRELKRAGYKLNASSFGRRCLGTDATGVGYDDGQFYSAGKVDSLVTRIVTRMIDHSINLGVLKHHSIAGMSAGMKNMYGAINNPNKYHGNNCSPFAADVNRLEPIRKKHRLTIIDAVRVQYDKGPGFDPKSLDYYNGLVISEDPVAADRIGLEILEYMRKQNGLPALSKTAHEVKYLKSAEEIGLGINDITKIDLQVQVLSADGAVSKGELF